MVLILWLIESKLGVKIVDNFSFLFGIVVVFGQTLLKGFKEPLLINIVMAMNTLHVSKRGRPIQARNASEEEEVPLRMNSGRTRQPTRRSSASQYTLIINGNDGE